MYTVTTVVCNYGTLSDIEHLLKYYIIGPGAQSREFSDKNSREQLGDYIALSKLVWTIIMKYSHRLLPTHSKNDFAKTKRTREGTKELFTSYFG